MMAHRHPGTYRSRTPRGRIVNKMRPIHKHSPKKISYRQAHDIFSFADKVLKIYEVSNYISSGDRENMGSMIQTALISHLVPVYGQARAIALLSDAARRRDFPQVLRQWIKLAGS